LATESIKPADHWFSWPTRRIREPCRFPRPQTPITVVIVDANLLVAEGLSVMMNANPDLTVVAIAGTCADGLDAVTLSSRLGNARSSRCWSWARAPTGSIMRKLGVHSRLEAVAIAVRWNIQAP
jgi:hypothetical protein